MEEDNIFEYKIRPRWSDFDLQKMANNATYLTYIEEAHLRFFEKIKLNWSWGEKGLVVVNSNINYKYPILFGDKIIVQINSIKIGTKSLVFYFTLINTSKEKIYATATLTLVLFDFHMGKSIPLTKHDRNTIRQSIGKIK